MPIKDIHVWEQYTRGVTPAKAKKSPMPARKEMPVKKAIAASSQNLVIPARTKKSEAVPILSPTFERKREKLLRKGNVEIDAQIDLHGMTQEKALAALARFIHKNVRTDNRHLLIITGKGRDGEGVLRRNLKDWLEQLPEAKHILAFRPAGIKHGGNGAFYVMLKKKSLL